MEDHSKPKPEHLGSGGAQQAGSALKTAKEKRDAQIAKATGSPQKKRKFSF